MIINEKSIRRLIKESLLNLIVEKAKFSKVQNFLKNPDNRDRIYKEIEYVYKTAFLKDFENDPEVKEEADRNINNAFNAFLNSDPKQTTNRNTILYLDNSINRYVKDVSNLPEFGNAPFYESPILLKKIIDKNDFSEKDAQKELMKRLKSFTGSASSLLSNLLAKSFTHDLQRKLKSDFMQKNKDTLEDLNFVHYPYAFREYSETDTSGTGAVLEVLGKPLEFLKGTVVNSPDELAGIGYPKGEELRDSIGMGSELGGKIAFPYIGFLITGKITYFDEKDAQSSTYRSSYVGGQRDNSGFVRYPKDIQQSMVGQIPGAYKTKEELQDYLANFDQKFGSQTSMERAESEILTGYKKHNYGEAFIDNWTAIGMIAQWDLIVKKFKEKITSSLAELELDPKKELKQQIKRLREYNPAYSIRITYSLETAKQNLDIVNLRVEELMLPQKQQNKYNAAKSDLESEWGGASISNLAKKLGIQKEKVPAYIEDYIKNIKPTLEQLISGNILYHELNNDKVKQFINDHDTNREYGSPEERFKTFYDDAQKEMQKSGTKAKINLITTGLERINTDLTKFELIDLKSYDKNFNEYDIKDFIGKMRQAIAESVSQIKTKLGEK